MLVILSTLESNCFYEIQFYKKIFVALLQVVAGTLWSKVYKKSMKDKETRTKS